MTTSTESDIKELKELINQRFDELKADRIKQSEQVSTLETGQANLSEQISTLAMGQAQLSEQVSTLETGQANLSEQVNSLETGQAKLEKGQAKLSEQIHFVAIGQAKIETRMDEWKTAINKIPDLAEKVGELKNWRQIAFVVITATAGGFIGWLIKGGNINP